VADYSVKARLAAARVFPKTLGAFLPLLEGEGRGEDGRATNFIDFIGINLWLKTGFLK
jgi:hypothetical protein